MFHQNTAGVPGSAETDDEFGSALTTADLDRDGYARPRRRRRPRGHRGRRGERRAGRGAVGGPQGLSGGTALASGRDAHDALGAAVI
ncbi:hypothetical protein GCM10023238_28470 [Streptomyces heliomycini]